MNAMRTPSTILLLAALAAITTLAGCGGERAASDAAADSLAVARLSAADVVPAVRGDLTAGVPVSGTLEPGLDVKLTSPLDDVIAEVKVREGERVAAGQVLGRFRTEEVEAAAASAEAQLKVAAADLERYRNLLSEGAVSQRDYDATEAAWRAAKAAEAAATKHWQDATVRSPFAGTVATRSVESGDRVGTGDPLFRVVNTTELEFEAAVPAEYVKDVRVGVPVALEVSGSTAGSLEGRVARVNATADPATRQVKVYVRVPNPGGRLVAGLFASGNIVTSRAKDALAVPAAAVRDDAGRAYVLIVENGALARREVVTGVRDVSGDRVEIVRGLDNGALVVTGPIEGLTPGQRVRVDAGGK